VTWGAKSLVLGIVLLLTAGVYTGVSALIDGDDGGEADVAAAVTATLPAQPTAATTPAAPASSPSPAPPTATVAAAAATSTSVPPTSGPPPATATPRPPAPSPTAPAANCAPATQAEVDALVALVMTKGAAMSPSQAVSMATAVAYVDRNFDGVVDSGVCREDVQQATTLINQIPTN